MKKGYVLLICMGLLLAILLSSCNIGLKGTHCPTNNKNFFSQGQQPKWYKH